MVKATVINALLLKIQRQADSIGAGDPIEITTTMLESSNISSTALSDVLQFMSTHPNYNCIEVEIFPSMGYADDGFQTVNVIGRVRLLPNFDIIAQGFTRYYRIKHNPNFAVSIYPGVNWQGLKERFEDPEIEWDSSNDIPDITGVDETERNKSATVNIIGNDVVVNVSGRTIIIKKLRNNQAPVYFIRYMLQNPSRLIDAAQIQDDVKMCSQKKDMTELVRQCGFNKAIKSYFFNGTTKDQVRLIPTVELSDKIVTQLLS